MNYQEEKKYVGHRDQLMRIKRFRMQEGKAEGGGTSGCSESFGNAF